MYRKALRVFSLFLFLFFLSFPADAQDLFPLVSSGDTFRDIIPYVTTRAEVEKKLGKPDKYGRYEFDEGRVTVLYRETVCDKSNTECLCLSPVGSVLLISVNLFYDLKIEDLKLDPKIWTKADVTGEHAAGGVVYNSAGKGITYDVINGLVTEITYRVSEKTCKMLERSKK
jgi:hypothetical protein